MPGLAKYLNPTARQLIAVIESGYGKVEFDGTVPKNLGYLCPLIDDAVCPGPLFLTFQDGLSFVHGEVRQPLFMLSTLRRAYLIKPSQTVISCLSAVEALTISEPIESPYSIVHLRRLHFLRCVQSSTRISDFRVDHLKHLIVYGRLKRMYIENKNVPIYHHKDASILVYLRNQFDLHMYDNQLLTLMNAAAEDIDRINLIGNCDFYGMTVDVSKIKSLKIGGIDHPDLSMYTYVNSLTLDHCNTANIILPPRTKTINFIDCIIDGVIPAMKTVFIKDCIIKPTAVFVSVFSLEVDHIVDEKGQSLKPGQFLNQVKYRNRSTFTS